MFDFRRWAGGYVIINLKGYNQERFINICNGHEIVLRKVINTDNGYSCIIRLKDYKALQPIARKTGVVPYIAHRRGLPFILNKMKRHISLPVTVLLFFVIILYLSLFIWNIEVIGGHIHTENQIVDAIKEIGIKPGSKVSDINCKSIEDFIRNKYSDIGWVSAEVNGTNLKISINEVNQPVKHEKDVKKPSHILAVKSGKITGIVTRAGIPKVKAGDTVNPGDVLVSGIIELHDDAGYAVEKKAIISDADIYMETHYEYSDYIEKLYNTRVYTGNCEKWHEISLFNNKIISYNYGNSYDKYDIITEVNNVHLFEDFYLPISFVSVCKREYVDACAEYTNSQCIKLGMDNLSRFLDKIVSSGGKILSNSVIPTISQEGIYFSGEIITDEPAWKYVKIKQNELEMNKADEYK